MKLTYNNFIKLIKTNTAESTIAKGLFISRSVIGINSDNKNLPLFGFAAAFDQYKSVAGSQYELLEHLVFLPYAHNETSLKKPALYSKKTHSSLCIENFFIGAPGPKGPFTANGCAISTDIQRAIDHSRHELLERHTCCQIWYDRNMPLLPTTDFKLSNVNPNVKLRFYTTNLPGNDKFAAASLECNKTGFFTLGAAVRYNIHDAYLHAASEALMLFEDMHKDRLGTYAIGNSQMSVLSLRNRIISKIRMKYLQEIIDNPPQENHGSLFECETVCFEPLPNIFACRSFSDSALDPKQFATLTSIPTLPLF